MEFIPVQFRIKDNIKEWFKDKNGQTYNYLLQVWNPEGKKIFEQKLVNEITQWCICFEYFVYKTEEGGPEDRFFQVINLKTDAKTLIEGFLDDVDTGLEEDKYKYFALNDNKLYAASQKTIKIATIKLQNKKTKRPLVRKIRDCDISTINMHENTQQ